MDTRSAFSLFTCESGRSPVCYGLLEEADQFAAGDGVEVRTAGVCCAGVGLCDDEVFTGAAD